MARRLEPKGTKKQIPSLERAGNTPFRIALETRLTNGYEIKDLRQDDIRAVQAFLESTVYSGATITQVDTLYSRQRSDAPPVKYGDIELEHYGKKGSPFRIFGYYNNDRYFVICRIDGRHKTHKV